MTEAGSSRQAHPFDLLLAGIALLIASYLIFQNLGTPAIRQWDEAIYANNTLDMYHFGDPIVMRRNGEITFYNTKPPLVIWLQTLSMHVFGVNEFAVRFPSALAGVLCCVLLLLFSIKTLKDIRIGIVAVLILATAQGFVNHHVTKTGDLDAVLVFWTTAYSLLFLHFLLHPSERYHRAFTWIGVCVACAFLSKGVAGLMPLPGLVICALVMRKAKWIFSQWYIWIVAGAVLAVCMGYYVLRETLSQGYLYKTWYSEYSRYFINLMSWHNHPWYYYFWNWERLDFFTPYVYWLPVALVAGLLSKTHRTPTLLLTIQVLVFVGIFSYPIIKLMWYDAPVYPLLSLLCALGGIAVWDFIQDKLAITEPVGRGLFILLLGILFFIPMRDLYRRNVSLRLPVDILEREGYFVRELKRTRPDLTKYKVLMMYDQNAHYTQLDFYLNAYNRHEGYKIELIRDTSLIQIGDTIVCCQEKQKEWVQEHFVTTELQQNEIGCVLVKVGRE